MQAEFDNMVKEMLGYGVSDEIPEAELTRLTRIYAYSPFIQYLFSLHLKEKNDPRYAASVAKTALYFSNPHWLNHQLRNGKPALVIEGKAKENKTADTRTPEEFSTSVLIEIHQENELRTEEPGKSVSSENDTTASLDLFILEAENEGFSDPDEQGLLEQVENELRVIDNSTTELITAIVSDADLEAGNDVSDPDYDFRTENFESNEQFVPEGSKVADGEPGQHVSSVNETSEPENHFDSSHEDLQVEEVESVTPTEEFIQIPDVPEEKPEHDNLYQLSEADFSANNGTGSSGNFDEISVSAKETDDHKDQIFKEEVQDDQPVSDAGSGELNHVAEEPVQNEVKDTQPDFSEKSHIADIGESVSIEEPEAEKVPEQVPNKADTEQSDIDDTDPVEGSEPFSDKADPAFKMPGLRIETNQPLPDKIDFEPLHTVDYFASQGIKLSVEDDGKDKLANRLKSFTDWLKSMKKIHPERLSRDMDEKMELHIKTDAEQSNDKAEILTETMAEILQKQGLIEKALEVYEKLSLLNPSKSDYFAAKISALKAIGI